MTNAIRQTLPADARADNWVERYAPAMARPYLRLMRADRPIGTWLLLIPCWWGLAVGLAAAPEAASLAQAVGLAALFAVGAAVMRGAGCAYNDIVDRDIDAKVARTAGRPLPAGQISVRAAWAFLVALCLIGLGVLVQLNATAIAIGLASLALVAAYPFAKRITWWPQAFLGLTFNWGVLVGYAAITGEIALAAMLIYFAGVFWTLGYDTIYAHQDRDDDALIGVKSTARLFGARTRPIVAAFYALTIALFTAGLAITGAGSIALAALALPAAHFAWQVATLDIADPARCLAIFRANRGAGLLLLAPLLAALVFVS